LKIIITCGGTGGHIYPAITLANAFMEQNDSNIILFVGALGKMEMEKIPKAGYKIIGLNIKGIQRGSLIKNLSLPFLVLSSLWQARRIIKTFLPDLVIGTGGYASGPTVYMSSICNIPTIIQEQNAIVGITNKILGKYVDRICIAFKSVQKYFPLSKTYITGNPIRAELLSLTHRTTARYNCFELNRNFKCVLILSGSLGSQNINECVLKSIDRFIEESIQLIWVTGQAYFEFVKSQVHKKCLTFIKIYPFIDDITSAYEVADVIVSRGGAMSISELCIVKKPVVFVPSPNVTNNHQTENVMSLVDSEAALIVKDCEIDQYLSSTIIMLLKNDLLCKKLSENISLFGKPNATRDILNIALDLVAIKKAKKLHLNNN